MFGVRATRGEVAGDDLFRRIGAFLAEQRLSPDPVHYAFAHHVLRDPSSPLAQAVASITDGGVRLSREDIERLGGQVATGAANPAPAQAAPALVAETQAQVESFSGMVRSMQDEAGRFGRDLAASAEAIQRSSERVEIDDIVQMTGAMIQRVRATERRLEEAQRETDDLRAKLAEAQGSARRDPLTDLPNRRALEEAFAAVEPGTPVCLAVCDIDRFKTVNDTFGHGVGDRVLKAIGQTLAAQCGPHLVARYGGEEFAVLFVGAGVADARAAIEAARDGVAARRFRVRETDQPLGSITFSAGLGVVGAGERFESAFARVDRALYRAKADGRDRVVMAARAR